MYTYYQAYGLSREFGSQFQTIDIADELVGKIFNNYVQVYLSLNYTYSKGQVLVDFSQLKKQYRYSTQTLNQLLATIPDGYFNILPELPYFKVRYTQYMDSSLAGYTIAKSGNDLIISNPNIDTQDFLDFCITTVDGYVMPVSLNNNQITINNGLLQAAVNEYTKVGIVSFQDAGQILIENISLSNINLSQNRSPDDLLYIQTQLPIGYATFLVLNGYLIASTTDAFYCIGNGLYALSLRKLGYHYKLLDSRDKQYYNYDYILPFLPQDLVNLYSNSNNLISNKLISTPEFISAYLTLPNTFLLQVPMTNVIIQTKNIINTELVNSFVVQNQPKELLIGSQGKIVDYFYTYRKGKYVITSPGMFSNNYIEFKNSPNNEYLSNQRVPNNPIIKSSLYFKSYGFYNFPE